MTITPEQLDSLISYTRQLADKGSPYAACNHTQLSELLERLKKAEASVAELEAEVRRLQPFDRVTEAERVRRAVTRAEKAEARVAELEGLRAGLMKDAIDSPAIRSLRDRAEKAESDRAVLVEALTRADISMDTAAIHGVQRILGPAYQDSWAETHRLVRAALAKAGEPHG